MRRWICRAAASGPILLAAAVLAAAAAPALASPAVADEPVPQTQPWVIIGAVAIAVAVCVYAAVGFLRSDRRFKEQERRQKREAPAAARRSQAFRQPSAPHRALASRPSSRSAQRPPGGSPG